MEFVMLYSSFQSTWKKTEAIVGRIKSAIVLAPLCLFVVACSSTSTNSSPMQNSPSQLPPILFVHGNGDTAGIWQTTLWRFESNGWASNRLHAIDVPFPLARDDDNVAQDGRSSTQDQVNYLSAEVKAFLQRTGAEKVVLVANSRGGNAVRNYIQNKGGAEFVSHAILSGVPNHGIWLGTRLPNSEFNGSSAFIKKLNEPKNANGDEVVGPVKWLTIRSDNNDKFAQPDGLWIGQKGVATGISFDAPALKGATNIELASRDHREVAFHRQAFKAMYEFITQKPAPAIEYVTEQTPVLNGKIAQLGIEGKGEFQTNNALVGALVEVYAVDGQGARQGDAKHRQTVGSDGMWGPFTAQSQQAYEFVVTAPSYAVTHFYRAPFVRSSSVINMRPARIAPADKAAASVLVFNRPRGYFGVGRDVMEFDGKPLNGIVAGVAGASASKLVLTSAPMRSVTASFNGEKIAARAWPTVENHLVYLELHQ
jgi:triacylglycerol lipase